MKKIQAPFSQPLAIDDDPSWGKWTAEDKRDNQGLSSSSCFLAGATETLDVIRCNSKGPPITEESSDLMLSLSAFR